MTWPPGGPQGPGEDDADRTQPYQGSYPTNPFPSPDPPAGQGAFGGPGQWGGPAAQPYGSYPGPGGPPRRRRTGLLIGLVALAVVVVVGVVVTVALLRDNNGGNGTDGPVAGATSTAPPASTGAPTSTEVPRPDAVVPGWQVAVSGKRNLAYDVPPEWTVLGQDTVVGFEDGSGEPQVGASGAATYLDGYCDEAESSWRAATGFSSYDETDLELVANDAAERWATYGYLGPNDEEPTVDPMEDPVENTVNGMEGMYVKASVRPTVPAPCAPPSAVVHAFALPADEGSFVFVVIADQEVPDALPEDRIRQIINTIRPIS